jgi:hypothetical protein
VRINPDSINRQVANTEYLLVHHRQVKRSICQVVHPLEDDSCGSVQAGLSEILLGSWSRMLTSASQPGVEKHMLSSPPPCEDDS